MVVGGVEVEEQLVDLVGYLVDPSIGPVDLVDHHDGREFLLKRLRQHIAGLRHWALGGIDEQEHAVDEGERPFDLAAEIGVAGGVDEVDLRALPLYRSGLREDRDAALAFLVTGVHHSVDVGFMGREHAGGAQHGVDERGLAMVDVRDQRNIPEGGGGHVRDAIDRIRVPRVVDIDAAL